MMHWIQQAAACQTCSHLFLTHRLFQAGHNLNHTTCLPRTRVLEISISSIQQQLYNPLTLLLLLNVALPKFLGSTSHTCSLLVSQKYASFA